MAMCIHGQALLEYELENELEYEFEYELEYELKYELEYEPVLLSFSERVRTAAGNHGFCPAHCFTTS